MRRPSLGRRATVLTIGAALTLGLSGCDGLCTGLPFLDAFFCQFNEVPVVVLTASPNPVVTGHEVTLDSSQSTDDGAIASRKWSTMNTLNDLLETGATVTRTFEVPNGGTIQPSVTLTDDEGDSATGTVDLQVVTTGPNVLPLPSFTISPEHPDAADFTDFIGTWVDDSRVVQAEWDLDGVPGFEIVERVDRSEMNNEQSVRLPAGERDVFFRVTDDRGGQGTAMKHLVVDPANIPPIARLTITPNPGVPPGIRVGEEVTFDASASNDPDGTIDKFLFDIDGDPTNALVLDDDGDGIMKGSFTSTGDKTVGVRVIDDDGGRDELFTTITVNNLGRARIAAVRRVRPVRFTARLTAGLAKGAGVHVVHTGHVQRVRGVAAVGRFKGKLGKGRRRAPKLLRAVLRAPWTGTIDASVNTATQKRRVRMLALAKLRRGARSCLRITMTDAPGRRPRGTFRVLGGTRAARRLTATGRFNLLPDSRVSGRLRARAGRAHALPAACRAMLDG